MASIIKYKVFFPLNGKYTKAYAAKRLVIVLHKVTTVAIMNVFIVIFTNGRFSKTFL